MAHVLLTLEQRLERIRQSHLAKNRSTLAKLSTAQHQAVQLLTYAITSEVLRTVAQEFDHSAEDQKKEFSEVLSLLFELSE
jgi:glutamyl-tRNA reductase